MPLRKIASPACQILSTACLAAGCAAVGQWVLAAGCATLLLAPLIPPKWRPTWLPTAALVASVCLAGGGTLTGAPSLLMVTGAAFALASWDLALLYPPGLAYPAHPYIARFENAHIRSLALALGAGLLAAVAVRWIRLEVPFGFMVLLAVLALLALDGLWRMLND